MATINPLMSYLDDSKETQDNQEPVTQPTQVDPTGIRSYVGAQPAKPTQEPAKAAQPIADTTGIPDNVFDELGQDLRNSDPLPPSWVGPTVERWFKDNHPEIQIPEGFIDVIDTNIQLVRDQVGLREKMGYGSEEAGATKAFRDLDESREIYKDRTSPQVRRFGYVPYDDPDEVYQKNIDNLNEAITTYLDSMGNTVANAALLKGVIRELGIAAEFHAAPSRDRISAREAQLRYESPVARQVTNQLQDALQTAFVRSNVAEVVERTGTRAPDPIQAVFEGLESQGYDVRQEAEGLRIRTPEIEDGTGGRWATISYESLSPGFFGFDNGEQLFKQILATVGIEVGAEAGIRGLAKVALAPTPLGRLSKAAQLSKTFSNVAKMNRRFKRMGLMNQSAFSTMLRSAVISPTKTARATRFTGRALGRGALAAGANELYLRATERDRAAHAVDTLNLDAQAQALRNSVYLGLTEDEVRDKVITALYKESMNNERIPTFLAGAAGSAVFDMIGLGVNRVFTNNANPKVGSWRNSVGTGVAFNPKTLRRAHKTFGALTKAADGSWDISGVHPQGMRILESWGVVERTNIDKPKFWVYSNPDQWTVVEKVGETGYYMDDLVSDVVNVKAIQNRALNSVAISEADLATTKVGATTDDKVRLRRASTEALETGRTSESQRTILEADKWLANQLDDGVVEHSVAHMLDVLTRGSDNVRANSLVEFVSKASIDSQQAHSNRALQTLLNRRGLTSLDETQMLTAIKRLVDDGRFDKGSLMYKILNKEGLSIKLSSKKIAEALQQAPLGQDSTKIIAAMKKLASDPDFSNKELLGSIEEYYVKSLLNSYGEGKELSFLTIQDIPSEFYNIRFSTAYANNLQEGMRNIREVSTLVGAKSPEEAEGILRKWLAELRFSPLAAHTGSPWNILKHNASLAILRMLNVTAASVRQNPEILRDLVIANRLGLLLTNSPRGVEYTKIINRVSKYVGMSDEAKLGLQKVVDNLRENPHTEAEFTDAKGRRVPVGTKDIRVIYKDDFTELPFVYKADGKYTKAQRVALQEVGTTFVKDASGKFYFTNTNIQKGLNDATTSFNSFDVMIKAEDL